jgi:hypothetical protein
VSNAFDVGLDPNFGDAVPIIGKVRPPVVSSADAAGFTDGQRARWAGRADAVRVVHEGAEPLSPTAAYQSILDGARPKAWSRPEPVVAAVPARQGAAGESEAVLALKVQVQALEAVVERLARQLEQLMARGKPRRRAPRGAST